jgi:hypothetical protein
MTVMRFRVQVADEAQAEEVAAALEQRLARLDAVEEVQAAPERTQAIGEIVLVVTGAAAIARGGLDVVTCLRQAVNELRGLVEDLRGPERALVEVGDDEVDVRDVGDAELEAIAADEG